MKSNRKISPEKNVPMSPKYIRFESAEQVELIRKAAVRRGLSFVGFVRLACVNAAEAVLVLPPDQILGRGVVFDREDVA